MTLTLLEEKRAALKLVSKRLWEMSREAEMLACDVPEMFDADYGVESGYTSDNDNVNYAWSWLSEASDNLGGGAQLVEDQMKVVDFAESECKHFRNALYQYLHGDKSVDLREVNENRRSALRSLVSAGLSKSQANAQLKAIEDELFKA